MGFTVTAASVGDYRPRLDRRVARSKARPVRSRGEKKRSSRAALQHPHSRMTCSHTRTAIKSPPQKKEVHRRDEREDRRIEAHRETERKREERTEKERMMLLRLERVKDGRARRSLISAWPNVARYHSRSWLGKANPSLPNSPCNPPPERPASSKPAQSFALTHSTRYPAVLMLRNTLLIGFQTPCLYMYVCIHMHAMDDRTNQTYISQVFNST
ncbi:hypothetical protein X777_13082 [Ooceraea biroi]|uniref:Uncharacterized protein n=1 Tax=Ooceraea biroi TaxID=2015173 RepID=A0A026WXT2_OOCBI|nr:hypothetical protein X777_13082 [Ooceraea biroi]